MKKYLLLLLCLTPFLMGQSYRMQSNYTDYCADANAVGCWRMNEDTNHVEDISGNDNHCSKVASPTFTTSGKESGAYDFEEGSSQYLTCGDIDAIDSATDLTIVAWVKLETIANDNYILDNSTSTATDGILFLQDDVASTSGRTDTFTIFIADSADTDIVKVEGATNVASTGTWIHVAATIDLGSATGLRLYVNGVEDANSPANISSISAMSAGTDIMTLASFNTGASHMDGLMDEIGIWTRILTQAEIKDIYLNGLK